MHAVTRRCRTRSPPGISARRATTSGRCSPRSATTRSTTWSTPRCRPTIRRRRARWRRCRRAADRDRGPRRAAPAGRPQHGAVSMIGLGYYATITPAGDPPQRAREPGLVHRLHAVPAGDLAGPPRGAAQLPDDGRRPDRAADRQRVAARRGHGRRRGDDACPPGARAPRSAATVPRRRRLPAADPRRAPHPGRAARHRAARRGRSRRATDFDGVFGVLLQYPGASGEVRDLDPGHRGRARGRGARWRSPPTCWR